MSENMDNILWGDCLDLMETIPTNSVDCIVTDPPFFIPATHYQSRVEHSRKYSDLTPLKGFWKGVTLEFARILKPTGHVFVFCNCDSYPVFYEPMFNQFDKLKSIIWDKTRVGLGRIFRHQHELIIWARWGGHKFIGKTSSDVLSYPATLTKDRDHPVEKPVELIQALIEPTTEKGDVVFDPFLGGGSTCVAAHRLERKCLGIELDEDYFDMAVKKVNNAEKPLIGFV